MSPAKNIELYAKEEEIARLKVLLGRIADACERIESLESDVQLK